MTSDKAIDDAMRAKADNSERAFACSTTCPDQGPLIQQGLSKREWFAGMSLMGMVSQPYGDGPGIEENFAISAYLMADAMLKAGAE